MRFHLAFVTFLACSAGPAPTSSSGASSSTTASAGAGGHAGAGGSSSASCSSSGTSGGGGAGGEGGSLPPKPVDCAKINPGIFCVEDNDCPLLSKEELDACGPWSCAWSPPPDPDAGIAGKKRCEFQPKP